MTHDIDNVTIANIRQYLNNGDHVHLYGEAVQQIAHEVFGKDEDHLDLMSNNVDIYDDEYIVLNSNKGDIYITADDILAFHVPDQP